MTIKGILYSNQESITLDPMTLAYYSNVPANNRTTLDLHRQGETLNTTEYKTYTKPTRARSGAIDDTIGWVDWVATTDLPVTHQTALDLDVGKVLLIESEKVIVKAIDTTADTIDVYARGAGWTTGAAHAVDTPILMTTVAVPEGQNLGAGLFNERVAATNGTQIITKQAQVTFTEAKQKRKLPEDLLTEKTNDEMYDLVEDMNYASIFGDYQLAVPDEEVPWMTRGVVASIILAGNANLVNVTSGAFTETRFNAMIHAIWLAKWVIDTIILSPNNKKIANTFGSFQGRIDDIRWNKLGTKTDAIAAEGIGDVYFTVDHGLSDSDVIYCNSADMTQHYFEWDELRVLDTSDPTNPRLLRNSLMVQFGFNYTNLNRNFGLDRNLTT